MSTKYMAQGEEVPQIRVYCGAKHFVKAVKVLLRWMGHHGHVPSNYSLTNPYSKYFKTLDLWVGTSDNGIVIDICEKNMIVCEIIILNWRNEDTPLVEIGPIWNKT